jgi:multiple sugar transport system substrate-binding protein
LPAFLGGEEPTDALPPSSHIFLDTIPALRRVPSISTWPEIEDIFNAGFQRALYEEEFDLEGAISDVEASSEDAFRRARDPDDP